MKTDCCSHCQHDAYPRNSYLRDLAGCGLDWPHGGANDVAEPITDRLAALPDGVLLRLTPPGQPTVDEILRPGTLIRTSYSDRIRRVFAINERQYYGWVTTHSIALGDPDTPARADGYPKNYGGANIKELVYHDGAIRKLFWNNEDTVEVVGYEEIEADYQATIEAGWSA